MTPVLALLACAVLVLAVALAGLVVALWRIVEHPIRIVDVTDERPEVEHLTADEALERARTAVGRRTPPRPRWPR